MKRVTTESSDYRERVYRHYASRFRGQEVRFDPARAIEQTRPYAGYLRGWLPEAPDAMVLDAACGDGRLLHFFRQRGYLRVEGVDGSGEQVEIARQVVPTVEHGDVADFLESRPERYDLITAIDLIEHLRKDEALRFLDLGLAALRPGGRLVLQTPNGLSPWGGAVFHGDVTHETCYTPAGLESLLRITGFESIESREAGPWVHGAKSAVRALLWRGLRFGLIAWNLVEAGSSSRVLTRVFLASGRRP